MNSLKHLRNTIYLSLIAVITACGGGGGGSSFTPPDVNTTPIAIDSTNQYDVVANGTTATGGAQSGGSILTGMVVNGTGTITSGFNVFDFASDKLLNYFSLANGAPGTPLPTGAVVSQTAQCDSGSITISANLADPNSNTLSMGDTFTFSFNSCVDNTAGTTMSGSISGSVDYGSVDFSCTSSCADVTLTLSFNAVTTTDSTGSVTIHGGFTLAKSGSTSTFSGNTLYLIAGNDAILLTNFNVSSTDSTTSSVTLKTSTVNMTVASTLINGSITIKTNVPLERYDTELYPHAGSVTYTGSNNSSLQVDYLDETSVQLTLDANGDGTVDSGYPVTVLWTDINAAVTAQ